VDNGDTKGVWAKSIGPYICFIDYSKAFDCINHELMWKTLGEMGIPKHLIQLLKGLYEDQIAVIRTEYGDTDRIRIKKGVRQGCILSPFLFNLYAERIMRMARMDEAEEGIRIAGRTVNNLRYADDTTLLAGKKTDLVEIIRRLKRESRTLLQYKEDKDYDNRGGGQF